MAKINPSQGGDGIGKRLLDGGFVNSEQVEAAREVALSSSKELVDVLLEQGLISIETLASILSLEYNVPAVNLASIEVQTEAIAMIPAHIAREQRILPISVDGNILTIAMENPGDLQVISSLSSLTRKQIKAVVPVGMKLNDAIDRYYRLIGEIEQQLSQVVGLKTAKETTEASADLVKEAPVVQAVDMLLTQAVRDRASDIHIEPQKDYLRIRFRIDGVLHESLKLPQGVHSAILTRIKVMAGLNIAERRRPQDGQFSVTVNNKPIDCRVACIEGDYGEMAVIRILDKSVLLLKLSDLGMYPSILQPFEKILGSAFGMILVSGPTGSGKTTTLYAALSQLNASEVNIMTIEDPIEYRFDKINQIQCNRLAGITFAVGLRAIMRLDPDIILVGEIRDKETATTAVQAALTGHLVLSSIHANDSISAVIRLIDMGVEPFLVTSAVLGSLSQRLVRRVCRSCSTTSEASPAAAMAYQAEMKEERRDFLYGHGCNFCTRTGYLGRVGAFELLTLSDPIRRLLTKGASASEIKAVAMQEGMVGIRHDGMQKAKDSLVTPEEVLHNVFTIL
jgi:general secretion pathway protein E